MKKWTLIIICILVLSQTSLAADQKDASSVLNAFFKASGGIENLKKVQAVSFQATMTAYDYGYDVLMAEDGRLLYSDANQTVGADGETMWVNYKGLVGDVPESGRDRYEHLTFSAFFLRGLLDDTGNPIPLEYAGEESQLDLTFDLLKTIPGTEPERTYYFNTGTGFLEKAIETRNTPEGTDNRVITRFLNYKPVGDVKVFTAFESSDLSNGRMLQPRTELTDIKVNPALTPDRFQRPETTVETATVKDGEIRGKILDVSNYGSLITNIPREIMDRADIQADVYNVQIKAYTEQHRYIDGIEEVQIDRGDRIALFNNTPALWIVKAYDGMTSDIDAKAGDLVYLTPVASPSESVDNDDTPDTMDSDAPVPPPPAEPPAAASPAPLPDADKIMRYKPFGNTGLKVSDISVGGGSLSDPMVVSYALDKGMNYFDTAETYGRGTSEEAIGEIARTRRKDMIICTKLVMNGKTTKTEMLDRFEKSLKRLQTDYIDVLMIHGGNPDAINNPEIHEGFKTLKAQGKLKWSGVSSHGPNMTDVLWPVVRERLFDVILLSYDPVTYPDLPELLKAADAKGIALVAMKVFTSARSANLPEYTEGKYPFNVAALRWVLEDPCIDTCIPSVSFLDHVDQYVRASGYTGDVSGGQPGETAETAPDTDAGIETGSGDTAVKQPADVFTVIPGDLTRTDALLVFNADELWKHINGADHQYLAFGCRSLTVGYFQDSDGADALTVEVYEMPDASGSFGIYTRQKPRSGPFLGIGVEGYVSGNMLIFYKDRFYVQLAAPDETPASVTRLKNTARAMAAAIQGSDEPPAVFNMFPADLFNPDTFAYIYDGILGIQGLGNGYAAVARVADTDVTFYLIPESGKGTEETPMDVLSGAWGKWGETPLKPVTVGGVSGVHGIMKYKGPVTILTRDGIHLIITGTEPGDALATAVTGIFK